ncbi:uncharacterized protein BDZ83DRAFT_40629 [Colletotrichum acutatum]|uniref:Transmembrane protein n=1 Tax=Glomerella acutata TaxID=27357 RepID=A0AAD8XB06_GLOAC|nr:uncharacterized protein BDZ83DRAFT_40629 [Colletotrichum acutatum]KAK1716722.1 hypothetical protein BDZ83DRAFT_40629 [Colletotrichum acutatum]
MESPKVARKKGIGFRLLRKGACKLVGAGFFFWFHLFFSMSSARSWELESKERWCVDVENYGKHIRRRRGTQTKRQGFFSCIFFWDAEYSILAFDAQTTRGNEPPRSHSPGNRLDDTRFFTFFFSFLGWVWATTGERNSVHSKLRKRRFRQYLGQEPNRQRILPLNGDSSWDQKPSKRVRARDNDQKKTGAYQ